MIKPDQDVIKSFAHVAQNVPRVVAFIAEWRDYELVRLPDIATPNQALEIVTLS